MITTILGITARIISNSYLNVFQKILTNKGENTSVINFFTYLGLTLFGVTLLPEIQISNQIITNFFAMGFLGALGNYYIIKSLSYGELSSITPINAYKPIVALIIGIFLLNELPTINDYIGIFLIICGTIYLSKTKLFFNRASIYRFFALIFSATEAIFIKKIIILTNVTTSFFYWAFSGLIFSLLFVIFSKHKIQIDKKAIKYQLLLILMVTIMQYSTNFVFSKMQVAPTLALFQLSTILSICLGAKLFKEKEFVRKIIASTIMIIGAIIIILD